MYICMYICNAKFNPNSDCTLIIHAYVHMYLLEHNLQVFFPNWQDCNSKIIIHSKNPWETSNMCCLLTIEVWSRRERVGGRVEEGWGVGAGGRKGGRGGGLSNKSALWAINCLPGLIQLKQGQEQVVDVSVDSHNNMTMLKFPGRKV